jgi:hypothetical protein
MRFESLLWFALAMFLAGGARWDREPLVDRVGGSPQHADAVAAEPDYVAADGGHEVPPPTKP